MNIMIGKVSFFLVNLLIFRLKFYQYIKEILNLKKIQYLTIENNLKIQNKRLYELLSFAVKNVPYYKKIAFERNIKISKEDIFNVIEKLPILTKEIIRNNWDKLHANLSLKRYRINTSGGTTGEPVKLIQDINYYYKVRASELFFDGFSGYNPGNKIIRLWGDEREIISNKKSFIKFLINEASRRTLFLNSFKMSDEKIFRYIKIIMNFKPKVIIAYIQSIFELGKFIRQNEIKCIPINSIITSAGTLTLKIRNFIEETFKCNVFNRYGSREVGIIGSSCKKSNKLHINMYHQFIEILDENEKKVTAGNKGNIIITNLINYSMPLIRYKIGDTGSLNLSLCPCGRGFIRLNNVYGRIIDIFINSKGELVYGDYFTHLFYFRENVKQFQVIQEKLDKIIIKIVSNNNKPLKSSIIEDIEEKIKIVMGENCRVIFEYVDYINPSRSGKYIYTISNVYKSSN